MCFSICFVLQVRRWAVCAVQSLGLVEWEDYDDLEEVIKWMMTVITFDLFSQPAPSAGEFGYNVTCIYVCVLFTHMYVLPFMD